MPKPTHTRPLEDTVPPEDIAPVEDSFPDPAKTDDMQDFRTVRDEIARVIPEILSKFNSVEAL